MNDTLSKQLSFLVEIDKMKTIYRQSMIIDGSRRENDAEHSWHFALMALTLFEYCDCKDVNIDRVVKMALIHDLVEIYAGDTFAYDEIENIGKLDRENKAAEKLFSMLPIQQGKEYKELWEEFEAGITPDSKYANAIDKLHPFMMNYYSKGLTWKSHDISASMVQKRMKYVKEVMPSITTFIDEVIEDSIHKGYLK